MLKMNKILQFLSLANCELDSEDAECIADGLESNIALKTLNLAKNRINSYGCCKLADAVGRN
jgi:hypothetical protein